MAGPPTPLRARASASQTGNDAAHAAALVDALRRSPMRTRLVRMVVEDMSIKQMASAVSRSEHTVRGHLRVLYRIVGGTRVRLAVLGVVALRRLDGDSG